MLYREFVFLASTVLISVATAFVAMAQPGFAPSDPAGGSIEGRTAIGFWVLEGHEPGSSYLDPRDFEVHLIPAADPTKVLVKPCGQWLTIPAGRYRGFVQGKGRISPVSILFGYAASEFAGQGMAISVPTVEAGKIRIEPEFALPNTAALRLIHLDSHHLGEGAMQRELSRNASIAIGREHGVPMPVGPVLVAAVDDATGQYLALAKPVEVPESGTVVADLQRPRENDGALLTIVRRARPATKLDEDLLGLTWIDAQGRAHAPDVLVRGGSLVYGVWYRLVGSGTLRVDSLEGQSVAQPIKIEAGTIVRHVLRQRSSSDGS